MTRTCPKLSPALKSLLDQVKAEGLTGLLLHELEKDGELEFEMVAASPERIRDESGTMSDASKRRLTAETAGEVPASIAYAKAMPAARQKSGQGSVSFPPGIDTLATWGKTLIETGKFGKANLSYEELSSSTDREKQSYCRWMVSQRHRDNLTPMVRDLVDYLTAVTEIDEENHTTYPGTSSVRKL